MNLASELADSELTNRAVRGDERAFAIIVARYKDDLYRLTRRHVGNPDDAHDLLQQTFVAAWQALARYDTGRPLLPWLRTIALNKCRDHGRKVKVIWLLGLGGWGDFPEGMRDPQPTAEERWIDEEGLRDVDRAIADLPRQLKEPLLLTVFERLSHAEAGRELGLTAKAVETRVHRARRKLAQALDRPAELQGEKP